MRFASAILDSIDWLQKSRTEADFTERAILLATVCFPEAVVAYHYVGGVGGRQQLHLCADVTVDDFVRKAWRRHALESPVVRYYRGGGTDPVILTQELVSERAFRSTALFHECWRPLGVTHQAGLRVWSRSYVAGLSIKRDSHFRDCERKLLQSLHPHFLRAWKTVSQADGISLATWISDGAASRNSKPLVLLTSREREVLGWLAEGKRNREIAHILDIAPGTVKNHVENILRKLNAENRGSAAAMWRSEAMYQG